MTLEGRVTQWVFGEWLKLLEELRQDGHSQLVDTEVGKELLGRFLEENRT